MAAIIDKEAKGTTGSGQLARDSENKQQVNSYCIFVVIFISMSSAAYGYAGSIIATTLTQPSFTEAMNLATDPRASSLIGSMNALFYAGGVFGSFLAGYICNTLGRRWSVAIGNMILLVTGGLLTASVNPIMFIVFRFICGVG
jgi:MFS family permease